MTKTIDPDQRTPLAKVGGCVVTGVFMYLELSAIFLIPGFIIKTLRPALQARGYNPDVGSGFLLGLGLGLIVAIYPVLWLDRLRRRLGG